MYTIKYIERDFFLIFFFFLFSEITPAFFSGAFGKAKVNSAVSELTVQCQCCHVNWVKPVPVGTVGNVSEETKPKHERFYCRPPVKGDLLPVRRAQQQPGHRFCFLCVSLLVLASCLEPHSQLLLFAPQSAA